jgi:hypothetical protein
MPIVLCEDFSAEFSRHCGTHGSQWKGPFHNHLPLPPSFFNSRTCLNPLERPPASRSLNSQIIITHNLDQVVFDVIAHSFGTAITFYMMQHPPLSQKAEGHCDPRRPDNVPPAPLLVTYNFLYRTPKRADEWQLWYFASRDPDIVGTLGRHFFWNECIMWKENLDGERKVAVVLSEEDQIVDVKEVRRYLTRDSKLDSQRLCNVCAL